MFGASYSRTKFWVITLIIFVIALFPVTFVRMLEQAGETQGLKGTEIIGLIVSLFLINALANRIRDYGSNPWLALWALLPLVGLFQALYFGINEKRNHDAPANGQSQDSGHKADSNEYYSRENSASQKSEPELKRYEYETPQTKSNKTSSENRKPSKPLKRLE